MFDSQKFNLFELLQVLGLELSAQTGGYAARDTELVSVSQNKVSRGYDAATRDGSPIQFLNGKLFLRSIESTQENFKIKLFT
jgi:hypothetical protein